MLGRFAGHPDDIGHLQRSDGQLGQRACSRLRPSWHRQPGLESSRDAPRPDLERQVRVEMVLAIARVMSGHHPPSILRPR